MRSIDDLKAIVSFGGGLVVDAASVSVADLKTLASFAKPVGSQIRIVNAHTMTTDDMKAVASFGPGHVTFELLDD
jgi:hypothetical protein